MIFQFCLKFFHNLTPNLYSLRDHCDILLNRVIFKAHSRFITLSMKLFARPWRNWKEIWNLWVKFWKFRIEHVKWKLRLLTMCAKIYSYILKIKKKMQRRGVFTFASTNYISKLDLNTSEGQKSLWFLAKIQKDWKYIKHEKVFLWWFFLFLIWALYFCAHHEKSSFQFEALTLSFLNFACLRFNQPRNTIRHGWSARWKKYRCLKIAKTPNPLSPPPSLHHGQ